MSTNITNNYERTPKIIGGKNGKQNLLEVDERNYYISEQDGKICLMCDDKIEKEIANDCTCLDVRYIQRSEMDGLIVCLLQDNNSKDFKLVTTNFYYYTDYKHESGARNISEYDLQENLISPKKDIHIFDDYQIGFHLKDGRAMLHNYGYYKGNSSELDFYDGYAEILGVKNIEFDATKKTITVYFEFGGNKENFSLRLIEKGNEAYGYKPDEKFRVVKCSFGEYEMFHDSETSYIYDEMIQTLFSDIIMGRFPIEGESYYRIMRRNRGENFKKPISFRVKVNNGNYYTETVILDENLGILVSKGGTRYFTRVRHDDNRTPEKILCDYLNELLVARHYYKQQGKSVGSELQFLGEDPEADEQSLRDFLTNFYKNIVNTDKCIGFINPGSIESKRPRR